MATYVLIHGAGDVGWSWHLVAAELRAQGHQVIAPNLPCEDEDAGLAETAQSVLDDVTAAVGGPDGKADGAEAEAGAGRGKLVVLGHSLGGMVAPLVAERLARGAGTHDVQLVHLAAMVPSPGERPGDWWENTGYAAAARAQAEVDGGLTGNQDPYIAFFNGVPRELAEEAMARSRGQSARSMGDPWPLAEQPRLPTRFLLCREDRFFPAEFLRRVARDRLGVEAEEVPGGHCAMLSHPREIAAALLRSAR